MKNPELKESSVFNPLFFTPKSPDVDFMNTLCIENKVNMYSPPSSPLRSRYGEARQGGGG
jgi:hypothetical protein